MKYTVIGTPRVESEYSDEYETTMVIDLQREDGETGDVWIVAGVPDYQRGSSDAARTQDGYMDVRVFGDCVDMWCPESFRVVDEDGSYKTVAADVVRACSKVALETHREAAAKTTEYPIDEDAAREFVAAYEDDDDIPEDESRPE